MARANALAAFKKACEALGAAQGYEIIDVCVDREPTGRYLRVTLDQSGGIGLSDCERFHRAIIPQAETVDYDFLEVCSAGIDRELKTQRDFDTHVGKVIGVKLFQAIDKQKTIEGVLEGLVAGQVVLSTPHGTMRIDRKNVAVARPVLSIDELQAAEQLPLEDFGASMTQEDADRRDEGT